MSKEHSLAGQAEASSVAPQAADLDKRLEVRAVAAPDVNPVPSLYGISVDSVNQAEGGEQRVAEPLVGRQAAHVDGDEAPRPT